jgi:hypothetical protein
MGADNVGGICSTHAIDEQSTQDLVVKLEKKHLET